MNITIPKHVQVTDNGLIFYSNCISKYGVHSCINGKKVKVERIHERIEQPTSNFKKWLVAIILLTIAFLVHSLCSINVLGVTFVFLLFCYDNLFTLCEDFFHSHITKKGRQRQQFYAAQHMLFNSYIKLGRIPNLWELENKYYYGDMYKKIYGTFGGLLLTIFFSFYHFSGILHFFLFFNVVCIISDIIIKVLHKLDIFIRLEWLFLTEPTNIQLQVAIDALDEWIYLEDMIQNLR